MRLKFFRYLTVAILSLTALISSFSIVWASTVDFTTFTVSDAQGYFDVNADNITFTDLDNNYTAYTRKDFGDSYFAGQFTHQFTFQIDSMTEGAYVNLWGLNDTTDSKPYKQLGTCYVLRADEVSSNITLSLWSMLEDVDRSNSVVSLEMGVQYWVDIIRLADLSSMTLYVYEDEARTTLFGSCAIVPHDEDYRYIWILPNTDIGITDTSSGFIADLELNAVITPNVSTNNATVTYDYFDGWGATLNGTLNFDGGQECTAEFYYRVKGESEWTNYVGVSGTYTTGEIFSENITGLEFNETYEFIAGAYNTIDSDTGEIEEFTTVWEADVPIIQTLAYPIDLNIDTANATVYGYVIWDGTSNVTGWFKYKEASSSTWINTANTTELVTDDTFSKTITGLSLDTLYDYMACGQNDSGTAYGEIGQFSLTEVDYPTVETRPATAITATSARLWGYVSDNGSGYTWCDFQYKISGDSTWRETSDYHVAESANYSETVSNLVPNTTYIFRARAWNINADFEALYDYGNEYTFHTYSTATIPLISTDSVEYYESGAVIVKGSVIFDGGSDVTMYFQCRESGYTSWVETDYLLTGYTTGDEATWYITGLEDGNSYDVRAVGTNAVGTGYGNIIVFVMSTTVDTEAGEDGGDSPFGTSGVLEIFTNVKNSLGLTGTMGNWAFLALILLVVAILFGVAIVSVADTTTKAMIAVVWALVSVAVVGTFVFTGQLGVWPIVILVTVVVFLIFMVVGKALSGGNANG